ncbi:iron ABC transporter permease [Actinoplanes bogorensis]|uniref:Iron ABC transporter permease n=1 Tax=Paractinoplanes bogorensis TaxID=1610840 RepID=A0ABS5YX02_9ACTN|nr:iron ABC transporter permease [Actinoplanes bogorensis]MBU2667967.1 iron ABC transporter permease [Actinoplanes bogorensis]
MTWFAGTQRAAAVAVGLLALLPLAYVATGLIEAGGDTASLVLRPRVGELLTNTVVLVVLGVAACVLIGTAAAWLVERTDLPGRPLWTALLIAPLAVPAFVNSFGWFSLRPSFSGLGAALTVTTLSYYPLVYLPVAAVLRGGDPAHEEIARSLGHTISRTFVRVTLPQLRPAVLGGGLLVGLHLLAEFGALQSLRYDTFTTAIYDQYQSTFDGSAATALAAVLVLLCLLLLGGELAFNRQTRLSRTGSGTARPPRRHPLPARPLWVVALALLPLAALGVPIGTLVHWLLTSTSAAFPAGPLLSATGTTLMLALGGAAVTTALALPVAWLVVRRRGRLSTVIERSTYVGNSLPGIVVALALITAGIRWLPALYQSTAMLLTAYGLLFLPRAMVSLRAALQQAPPELDDVGRSLGVRPHAVLLRVGLPLIARGLGAGFVLVFLAVVTELTSTLLLAPIGTRTLATQFWNATSEINYGAAAPYALLMILISAPAAWLLVRRA